MKNIPLPPKRILFTKEGYQRILDEKQVLIHQRPKAVAQLSEARNMGDLSENGYYKAARARLSQIDGRLRHLEKLLLLGKIIEKQHDGSVGLGNTVRISDGTNTTEYTVVGGHESNPAHQTISYLSPLGKALMHKKNGDEITVLTPNGERTFHLISVR